MCRASSGVAASATITAQAPMRARRCTSKAAGAAWRDVASVSSAEA